MLGAKLNSTVHRVRRFNSFSNSAGTTSSEKPRCGGGGCGGGGAVEESKASEKM